MIDRDYNIILDTDSYKASHWLQYPPNTTNMFSYIESRGGLYDKTVFFGLQYYLKKYLCKQITKQDVLFAKDFYEKHGVPFNFEGWMYIVEHHNGYIPVEIKAVPEGSVVPTKNVLVTIESTDPKCFWVVSWIETLLIRIWFPINVATIGWHTKQSILKYLKITSDHPYDEIDFKLHDFGSRGTSSQESARVGGMAHLVNFKGSDTVVGICTANQVYNNEMSGFSIPASEHSTITAWGRENELKAYENMLKHYAKHNSVLACVSDSYDIYHACEAMWGDSLKQKVINSGATVVIRPDSGDPVEVVLKCLNILSRKFGVTKNTRNFNVLNHVRLIQGDGIDSSDILKILERMRQNQYSATNISFGMGGGLLQKHNRDTQRMAMKCSSITVNGEERDVFKSPIGDSKKISKKGRLDLIQKDGEFQTIRIDSGISAVDSCLQTVFKNGVLFNEQNLSQIRQKANEKF